ncbi:MAG: hypothetical protein ACHQUB_01945 [Candidatus Saccharimonadia bacterium]
MAPYDVTGDQYRIIDRRMIEIKRQLNQDGGSPLSPDFVARQLQGIIEHASVDASVPESQPTTSFSEAAAIMGPNFHSIFGASKLLGLIGSAFYQTRPPEFVPYSPETLRKCRQTHVLIECPPVSISELFLAFRELFEENSGISLLREAYATDPIEPEWYLVRKEIYPGSTSQSWDLQRSLLERHNLVTPTPNIVIYAIVIHYMATKEWLMLEFGGRTFEKNSNRLRISISAHHDKGIRIRLVSDAIFYHDVGVCEAHIPEN